MDVPLLTEVCFAFRSFFRDFKIIIRNNSGQLKPEVKFLKVNKNLLKNEYIAVNLPHSLIGKTELFPLLFPIVKSERFFPPNATVLEENLVLTVFLNITFVVLHCITSGSAFFSPLLLFSKLYFKKLSTNTICVYSKTMELGIFYHWWCNSNHYSDWEKMKEYGVCWNS